MKSKRRSTISKINLYAPYIYKRLKSKRIIMPVGKNNNQLLIFNSLLQMTDSLHTKPNQYTQFNWKLSEGFQERDGIIITSKIISMLINSWGMQLSVWNINDRCLLCNILVNEGPMMSDLQFLVLSNKYICFPVAVKTNSFDNSVILYNTKTGEETGRSAGEFNFGAFLIEWINSQELIIIVYIDVSIFCKINSEVGIENIWRITVQNANILRDRLLISNLQALQVYSEYQYLYTINELINSKKDFPALIVPSYPVAKPFVSISKDIIYFPVLTKNKRSYIFHGFLEINTISNIHKNHDFPKKCLNSKTFSTYKQNQICCRSIAPGVVILTDKRLLRTLYVVDLRNNEVILKKFPIRRYIV